MKKCNPDGTKATHITGIPEHKNKPKNGDVRAVRVSIVHIQFLPVFCFLRYNLYLVSNSGLNICYGSYGSHDGLISLAIFDIYYISLTRYCAVICSVFYIH